MKYAVVIHVESVARAVGATSREFSDSLRAHLLEFLGGYNRQHKIPFSRDTPPRHDLRRQHCVPPSQPEPFGDRSGQARPIHALWIRFSTSYNAGLGGARRLKKWAGTTLKGNDSC